MKNIISKEQIEQMREELCCPSFPWGCDCDACDIACQMYWGQLGGTPVGENENGDLIVETPKDVEYNDDASDHDFFFMEDM